MPAVQHLLLEPVRWKWCVLSMLGAASNEASAVFRGGRSAAARAVTYRHTGCKEQQLIVANWRMLDGVDA